MSIDRLLRVREENNAAGLAMLAQGERFAKLANRHIEGTAPKAVTGFNLFQTPKLIAAQMADILTEKVGEGARILEPSVGLGRLCEPLEHLRAEWIMVEEQAECCRAVADMLKNAGWLAPDIQCGDFLSTDLEPFDGIIMNPPFKQGRDVKHIQHALSMLKPGGRLVSLCYNGVKQNKHLRPMVDHWEALPAKSFKDEGTNADVALIVIDKE